MTTPTEMQAKVDKTVTNMDRIDDFVNGGPTEDVVLDGATVVPSIQKMVAESGLASGSAAAAGESATAASESATLAQAWASGTVPGGPGTKSALEWAGEAGVNAASAEAASGPTYASTAAGIAATTDGQSFAVDNGDGTVTIYRNTAGAAVAQRTLATTGYLAMWGINAQGLDATGATNISAALQALIGVYPVIYLPAGTFYAAINVTSPTVIVGAGRDETILTTEALTNGTTVTVNADLELRNLTVKGHPTNASSKTISHAGAYTVRARNVLFTGTNHDPSVGLSAGGTYIDCQFHTTVQPAGLGARCFSALAVFTGCNFTGARTVEARDSKFFSCNIGDTTTVSAVHIPDGATSNDGSATGYSGISEYWYCNITAAGTGITEGNEGKAKLRFCTVRAGLSLTGNAGLYARSKSTFDIQDCDISSASNGTAVSFAKTVGQAAGIGPSGVSVIKRTRIEGAFNALAIPTLSDTYPASVGNVRIVDCEIIGGDTKISPNTSTYHVFETERVTSYSSTAVYTADAETQRIRFRSNNQSVVVYGSDAAKTGCRLSHLDAVTGLPLPDGMQITLRYGGTSNRFVTFSSGATADGGTMYFADGVSALTTSQFGAYQFRLVGTSWRQIDGSSGPAATIANLAGGADLPTTVTTVNTILAALRTSGVII